jgi:D-lactate dehydrogenase
MRVTFFSTRRHDRESFDRANDEGAHNLDYLEVGLSGRTAGLASDADAVCIFVNDQADAAVLDALHDLQVRALALRCAGFNNVDVDHARKLGLPVVRVPAYSPHAVAEHTLALILSLDRKIHRAYQRVREANFSLDGLLGFDVHGRTAGVVGTGQIGSLVARLLLAFGCRVLGHDPFPQAELEEIGVSYVTLDELLERSDIVTLNCPLTAATYHLIDADRVRRMRRGAMLVNTGRGALIDTPAVIDGLKSERIGALALDVYEEEGPLFFEDRSTQVITDDVFSRLLTFPNVLITAHQGFFTVEAIDAIAHTTFANLDDLEAGRPCPNDLARL